MGTLVSFILFFFCIILLMILFSKYYRKSKERLSLLKAVCISLFASLAWNYSFAIGQMNLAVALIPFGFVIVFFLLKYKNKWMKYKRFAWLGFASNYILFLMSIIAYFLNSALYPVDDPKTFLRNIETTTVTVLDRNVEEQKLAKNAQEILETFTFIEQSTIESDELFKDSNYYLKGNLPKFGSKINADVYISIDGKQLLFVNKETKYKFSSNQSLFEKIQ